MLAIVVIVSDVAPMELLFIISRLLERYRSYGTIPVVY
jgi:hypothetical protein